MRFGRWRLRAVLIVVASLALACAGAVKWRRYVELRDRIAKCAREERRLRQEYSSLMGLSGTCGNPDRQAEAYLAVADERRHQIEELEREIWRIW
jgi:hypothetical protein